MRPVGWRRRRRRRERRERALSPSSRRGARGHGDKKSEENLVGFRQMSIPSSGGLFAVRLVVGRNFQEVESEMDSARRRQVGGGQFSSVGGREKNDASLIRQVMRILRLRSSLEAKSNALVQGNDRCMRPLLTSAGENLTGQPKTQSSQLLVIPSSQSSSSSLPSCLARASRHLF